MGAIKTKYTVCDPSLQRGQSLVQVMVALAIMSIIMLGTMTIMTDQYKQAAQLKDKLAALDLMRVLTSTFADGTVCTYMLTQPPGAIINPTNLSSSTIPAIDKIPSIGKPGASPVVIADSTTLASPTSDRLTVKSIALKNIKCLVPPCTPTSNEFEAEIVVGFDGSKTSIALAPLIFPVLLTTNGPPNAQAVQNCVGKGTAPARLVLESAAESCGGTPSHTNCPKPATGNPVKATCPAGFQLTGCGYKLSKWLPVPNDGGSTWMSNFHTNSPDTMLIIGNSCEVDAGGAPGCGVCFKAQAICYQF